MLNKFLKKINYKSQIWLPNQGEHPSLVSINVTSFQHLKSKRNVRTRLEKITSGGVLQRAKVNLVNLV